LTAEKPFRARFFEMLGRNDPPEVVAASFAVGVTISFTPFIGFHWAIALALAFILRLNKVDVLLGTFVVNPLTIGPIAAIALPVGRLFFRAEREALSRLPWKEFLTVSFWSQAGPRMRAIGLQWAAGMLILSLIAGSLTYVILVNVLRARRAREAAAAALPPGAIPEHGQLGEDENVPPSPR
jgi:uncharacterized protein (DUF2062 family)